MKHSRKLVVFILVLFVIFASGCSMLTGNKESGKKSSETTDDNKIVDGKYEDPITVTIAKSVDPNDKSLKDGDTIDDNELTRYITDKTNIKFDAELTGAVGESYTQKLQVAIASNNIPDIFAVGEKEFRQLVEADMVEDLTDVYEEYASDFIKDIYKSGDDRALENATFDGKLMAMPGSVFERDPVTLLWIRQDWLDKLGLDQPETLEDIEKVAKAFIEQDPDKNGKDDTIGITGIPELLGPHGFDSIFSYYDAYPNFWVKDQDDQVIHGSTAPQSKEALEKLRDWYEKGIIDKEFAIRDDANELVAGGKSGMFFGPWWSPWGGPIADAVQVDPEADWVALRAPLDKNGEFVGRMTNITYDYVVVRKGFEHPEALMLILNSEKTGEFSNLTNKISPALTPVRLVIDWSDSVTRRVEQFEEYLSGNKDIKKEMDVEANRLLPIIEKYHEDPTGNIEDWQPAHAYMEGGKALMGPMKEVRSLYYSQTKTMEAKWATLSKLQEETYLEIIMGRAPLDSFDKYVNKFYELGGDEITKEVEAEVNK